MQEKLDQYFKVTERDSTVPQELIAGSTIFFAMVYSVIVIPGMLAGVGFDHGAAFISTCLVAAFGSLLMGLWANLPMAIGSAISLTAFTAYSMVQGQGVSIPVALGAVFLMGVIFTGITVLGVRQWILNNLPAGIGHGTGVGIGLFLLLIAANAVGLVVRNPHEGLPVVLGDFTSMPVLLSVLGLAAISGLEKRGTHGGVLLVIILISVWGVIFDPGIQYQGIFARPNFAESSVFGSMDVMGALTPLVLPSVLALVLTSVFDATATIRAVAAQANLLDDKGRIENGNKALGSDSISSIFAGVAGGTPAAVYIESAAGTLAGGRTGLTATVVGVFFLCMIFLAPLAALVPSYAAAPALMYVGLLMMGNIVKIDFDDKVDALSGLTCAVFIVLTGNIVTGIMLGFATLVIGRVVAGEFNRLNFGIVITAVILVGFYLGGWDI